MLALRHCRQEQRLRKTCFTTALGAINKREGDAKQTWEKLISEQSGIITNSSAVRSVRRGSCWTSAGGNGLMAASRAPNDSTLLMQRGTELNGAEQPGQAHAELIYLSGKDEESPADESAVQRK
ncbi:hypothetical protein SRHO_G00138870 [Serrasalmus rhombeus]